MKLHIDTDMGGDIDDLCALAMALNWPGVEILGVTTVADHKGKRGGYVRYALGLAGRDDIEVATGADVSLGCYRDRPELPDEARYWPEPISPALTPLDDALDLLARNIDRGAIIAAIGPYTNLALLERRCPGILRRANLFLMGGYVHPPRPGFPDWSPETGYNVQVDVQSAELVFQTSRPTLITLAETAETALRRAHLPALRGAGPLARLIAHQAEVFDTEENTRARYSHAFPNVPEDSINFQHDGLACAIALGWSDGVEIAEIPLVTEVRDGWLYQTIGESGSPARVVTRANGAEFSEFWLRTVLGER